MHYQLRKYDSSHHNHHQQIVDSNKLLKLVTSSEASRAYLSTSSSSTSSSQSASPSPSPTTTSLSSSSSSNLIDSDNSLNTNAILQLSFDDVYLNGSNMTTTTATTNINSNVYLDSSDNDDEHNETTKDENRTIISNDLDKTWSIQEVKTPISRQINNKFKLSMTNPVKSSKQQQQQNLNNWFDSNSNQDTFQSTRTTTGVAIAGAATSTANKSNYFIQTRSKTQMNKTNSTIQSNQFYNKPKLNQKDILNSDTMSPISSTSISSARSTSTSSSSSSSSKYCSKSSTARNTNNNAINTTTTTVTAAASSSSTNTTTTTTTTTRSRRLQDAASIKSTKHDLLENKIELNLDRNFNSNLLNAAKKVSQTNSRNVTNKRLVELIGGDNKSISTSRKNSPIDSSLSWSASSTMTSRRCSITSSKDIQQVNKIAKKKRDSNENNYILNCDDNDNDHDEDSSDDSSNHHNHHHHHQNSSSNGSHHVVKINKNYSNIKQPSSSSTSQNIKKQQIKSTTSSAKSAGRTPPHKKFRKLRLYDTPHTPNTLIKNSSLMPIIISRPTETEVISSKTKADLKLNNLLDERINKEEMLRIDTPNKNIEPQNQKQLEGCNGRDIETSISANKFKIVEDNLSPPPRPAPMPQSSPTTTTTTTTNSIIVSRLDLLNGHLNPSHVLNEIYENVTQTPKTFKRTPQMLKPPVNPNSTGGSSSRCSSFHIESMEVDIDLAKSTEHLNNDDLFIKSSSSSSVLTNSGARLNLQKSFSNYSRRLFEHNENNNNNNHNNNNVSNWNNMNRKLQFDDTENEDNSSDSGQIKPIMPQNSSIGQLTKQQQLQLIEKQRDEFDDEMRMLFENVPSPTSLVHQQQQSNQLACKLNQSHTTMTTSGSSLFKPINRLISQHYNSTPGHQFSNHRPFSTNPSSCSGVGGGGGVHCLNGCVGSIHNNACAYSGMSIRSPHSPFNQLQANINPFTPTNTLKGSTSLNTSLIKFAAAAAAGTLAVSAIGTCTNTTSMPNTTNCSLSNTPGLNKTKETTTATTKSTNPNRNLKRCFNQTINNSTIESSNTLNDNTQRPVVVDMMNSTNLSNGCGDTTSVTATVMNLNEDEMNAASLNSSISQPTPNINDNNHMNNYNNNNNLDSQNSLPRNKRLALRQCLVSRYHEEFHEVCKLGSGEFGDVFKCINRLDGCTYAIKRSKKRIAGSALEISAWKEVCAHAVLVKHNHIVQYYSAWAEADRMLIQNEYCNGGSLAEFIESLKTSNLANCAFGTIGSSRENDLLLLNQTNNNNNKNLVVMNEYDLKILLLHIAKGLSYMHSLNLVHLDIKPGNIFICRSPRRQQLINMDALVSDMGCGGVDSSSSSSLSNCGVVINEESGIESDDIDDDDDDYLLPIQSIDMDNLNEKNEKKSTKFKSTGLSCASSSSSSSTTTTTTTTSLNTHYNSNQSIFSETITYKIGDLGHVTSVLDPHVEEGDCRYLPNEILQEQYDHLEKADVFALALTVFVSGSLEELPKNGDEWHWIRQGNLKPLSQCSERFNKLLNQMVHENPESRPSASALIHHPCILPDANKTKAQLRKELNQEKFKNEMLKLKCKKYEQQLNKIDSPNLTLDQSSSSSSSSSNNNNNNNTKKTLDSKSYLLNTSNKSSLTAAFGAKFVRSLSASSL